MFKVRSDACTGIDEKQPLIGRWKAAELTPAMAGHLRVKR